MSSGSRRRSTRSNRNLPSMEVTDNSPDSTSQQSPNIGTVSRATSSAGGKGNSKRPRKKRTGKLDSDDEFVGEQAVSTIVSDTTKRRKATRDSIEGRIKTFLGHSSKILAEALECRNRWINDLIFLNASKAEPLQTNRGSVSIEDSSNTEALASLGQSISSSTEVPFLPLDGETIHVKIDDDRHLTLAPLESISHSNYTLFHCGGHPTSIAWSPQLPILAVGVASRSEVGTPLIERKATRSIIQLWHIWDRSDENYNNANLNLTLVHNWGSAWSISWSPKQNLLAAVFADGNARVISIPWKDSKSNKNSDTCVSATAVATLSLENDLSAAITSLDWIDTRTIVVGNIRGDVALFDIIHGLQWCVPVHSSTVFDITACTGTNLVATTAADGYTTLLDTRDPVLGRASATRAKAYSTVAAWSRHARSVVVADDAGCTKLVAARQPAVAETTFSKHSGSITAIATSPHHPFVLSGGSDGRVIAGNSVARALVARRAVYHGWMQVQLFRAEWSDRLKELRFNDKYYVEEVPASAAATSSVSIFPCPSIVTDLTWRVIDDPVQVCRESPYFCASFVCGIVRLDRFPR
ncbi:WD40-repeat-containing domain protein [Dipodascopsis uninucleata]